PKAVRRLGRLALSTPTRHFPTSLLFSRACASRLQRPPARSFLILDPDAIRQSLFCSPISPLCAPRTSRAERVGAAIRPFVNRRSRAPACGSPALTVLLAGPSLSPVMGTTDAT